LVTALKQSAADRRFLFIAEQLMTPQDISRYIESLKARFKELEDRLADPAIYANHLELKKVSREHQRLNGLFRSYDRWSAALKEVEENSAMLLEEQDEELKSLIQADIDSLNAEIAALESKIRIAILPPDQNDSRNIIVELRPAAGGDEAALFTGELFRAYSRYAERRNWKLEILDMIYSDLGGLKTASFSLSGDDAFTQMKYESGVHRVQRVPATESMGRVHTSTITVAVMPEAEEVEIEIRNEDLRIDVFRSSGPGGQCVNTTDSAVRVTHLPTGLAVASQQEKSQHRNKEIAMRILRARLLERQQQVEADKQAADKRAQVGTGDRSERIRTYNFPQNRVTDHRYGISVFNLPALMEGELEPLFEQIIKVDSERRLEALNQQTK
jgi:peptide chain release factor 1